MIYNTLVLIDAIKLFELWKARWREGRNPFVKDGDGDLGLSYSMKITQSSRNFPSMPFIIFCCLFYRGI